MNKKSKEIVKKLCFTLVIVISIITIIGCPNTVSNKTNSGADKPIGNSIPWTPLYDPNDWSGLTADQVIEKMRIEGINDDVVTDLDGLGFGLKNGKLCLSYGKIGDLKGTPRLLSEAKEDIEKEIDTWNDYPAEDSYSDIKDGLEKRWFATHKTIHSKGRLVKWLEPTTMHNNEAYFPTGKVKRTYGIDIDINGLTFTVDVNEGKLFAISTSAGGGYQLFADWEIVFVEKVVDPKIPKMYSFHYGSYTLKGDFDEGNPKISDDYDNTKIVHVFTLSEMLKVYLRNKKKVPEGIAEQVIKKFSPLLSENKGKYDVYLVFGKISRKSSSEPFAYYEFVYHSFRNVLKLTDDGFWSGCWNQ